jgi:leader peptidase (prepilin peptidase)/N-methyltransferase
MLIDILYYGTLAFAGLCIGSFFNVLIWRIPRGESIVWPPSHCTGCGCRIKAYDNAPVISYLILRGKCRHCGEAISRLYPAVEILTAAAFLLFWQLLGIAVREPWYANIVPLLQMASLILLIPVSVIDILHYIIPDRFTLPFLALAVVAASLQKRGLTPAGSLLGALAGGGTLLVIGIIGTYILKKGDAMGLGDVKLMAYLGALWGYKAALLGIAFGALAGSIAGGIMILSKHINDDHRMPFGPYLAAGTVVAIFAGEPILRWYMELFGG